MVAGNGDDVIVVLDQHNRSFVLAGSGDDRVEVPASVGLTQVALEDGDDGFSSKGGAAAVWGGVGDDVMVSGPGRDLLHGGLGADQINGGGGDDLITGDPGADLLSGGPGSDIIHGGFGSDEIDGGDGDDLLFGDEGSDTLVGGLGADLLEGGQGADTLEGSKGDDRLIGGDGDDHLLGGDGDDLLMPGAGMDVAEGGEGDDLAVVLHSCQVGRGETLDGGDGTDTLLTALSLAELDAVGVAVTNFETIRQFPADGVSCDEKCNCGKFEHAPVLRRREMCDYGAPEYGLTPQERDDAEFACQDLLDTVPTLFDSLPINPTDADIEALIPPKWHQAFSPTRVAQLSGPTSCPHEPTFPPTNPLPNVSTSVEPCDMPQLDLHIGVATGGLENCYDSEKDEINEALDHARFMLFRMRQQIDEVADAPTTAAAEALWTRGSQDGWGRFALSNWFGEYDSARVAAVRSTVSELEEIFYADDDPLGGLRHNVQCFHRLKWWQYILFARLNPLTIAFKTVANTCFYPDNFGHATFAIPWAGRAHAAAVYYPFESIELCEAAFDDEEWDAPERLGGVIMHELLHFHDNSMGALKDRHGSADDGICDGPCYLDDNAESLALEQPNTAAVNIDNYRTWANATHTLYTDGYCDDTDPGICLTSDCCGDGLLQSDLSENCDGGDFGPLTCLTEAGLTEGTLTCSPDCQTITDGECDGSCGNDAVDPALGEVCDGTDVGAQTCTSLFGSEMGSLGCTLSCSYDTSGCEGAFPASYWACGVAVGSECLQNPEECHAEPNAGECTGGPCMRTDPSGRTEGQLDPDAPFHPRGNFRDIDGHLYRCEPGANGPRTCVDEEGYGVCRECGTDDGQTMLGCPCIDSAACGLDLTCFGGNFPHGGYCWSADDGPPDFQCEQGRCGQEFWGPDGGAYCEHHPASGSARCMPQRCANVPAQACSEQDLICDTTGTACAAECDDDGDCDVGWPAGTVCSNNECETP